MKRLLLLISLIFYYTSISFSQLPDADSVSHLHPAWSPDSDAIAFASSINGNFDIYAIDLNTFDIQNMSNHPADDYYPSWAPNGREIAYFSERERQHHYDRANAVDEETVLFSSS